MTCQPAYYAVIPSDVRYCKTLEPSARLLYGELTALANKEGYAWATNSYFADLYDVEERTVKYWIKSLEQHGFIEVVTQKNGMQWDRKIYIIQKNITKGKKDPYSEQYSSSRANASTDGFGRREKNFTFEVKKISPEYYIANTTRNNTCGVGGFHKILASVNDLSDAEKVKLSKAFSEEDISHALNFCMAEGVKIKSSFIQALWWAAKNKPEIPQDPKQSFEANKKFARSLENDMKLQEKLRKIGYRFEAHSDAAGIEAGGAVHIPENWLSYSDVRFKDKINSLIKKNTAKIAA